ncbi:hypothetical protein [Hespellia stercorisuis]|uniref:Uncharacterized protein n=1 Tax=Hespellia stercorisuis DSM 15480 TaxID=1121950 RepID=A0A1M6R1H4_9FIRM|nr:hypothetical protein [Hespellia stercorisuis]SHK26250.1 hypothetical protein SAMN02745243_02577 [Hespellia stercorisuis DSM 15480]
MRHLNEYEEQQNISSQALRRLFTPYKPVDNLLKEYDDLLKGQGIVLRVEGDRIHRCALTDLQFEKVLRDALQMAMEAAQECTERKIRFIHIRALCVQQKEFLKIVYSSDKNQTIQNEHYQKMEQLLEKKAGYLRLENGESENILMIAVGLKK